MLPSGMASRRFNAPMSSVIWCFGYMEVRKVSSGGGGGGRYKVTWGTGFEFISGVVYYIAILNGLVIYG